MANKYIINITIEGGNKTEYETVEKALRDTLPLPFVVTPIGSLGNVDKNTSLFVDTVYLLQEINLAVIDSVIPIGKKYSFTVVKYRY